MKIGILGVGLRGIRLGTLFARSGHEVTFSYSRDYTKLEQLAEGAHTTARAGTPREAAEQADAVLLAVPWSCTDDVLSQVGNLAGKLLISCSLPLDEDNHSLLVGPDSSGAEAIAIKVPEAHVVSAFNTIPNEVLFDVYNGRQHSSKPSLVFCGNDMHSKRQTAELIRDIGFEAIDLGPLSMARHTEHFGAMIAQLAYTGDNGPRMAYRFEWLG